MKKPKKASREEKKKGREHYVTPPEDFEVPEIEEGETFEVVMEVKKKADGLCIISWDGVPVKDEDEREEEADAEAPESIGAGARRAMEGGY